MSATTNRRAHRTLTIFLGPMYSGKSAELIAALRRHQAAGHRTVAFRARTDTRSQRDRVESRNGTSLDAQEVSTGEEILDSLSADYGDNVPEVVGIDEAQFISGLQDACWSMLNRGLTVYVAALNGTFTAQPWSEISACLPLATRTFHLQAVCSVCGAFDACYSQLMRDDDPRQPLIDGSGRTGRRACDHDLASVVRIQDGKTNHYRAVCADCWYSPSDD